MCSLLCYLAILQDNYEVCHTCVMSLGGSPDGNGRGDAYLLEQQSSTCHSNLVSLSRRADEYIRLADVR